MCYVWHPQSPAGSINGDCEHLQMQAAFQAQRLTRTKAPMFFDGKLSAQELMLRVTGIDICRCRQCGGNLTSYNIRASPKGYNPIHLSLCPAKRPVLSGGQGDFARIWIAHDIQGVDTTPFSQKTIHFTKKRTITPTAVGTDACGFLILQAKCNPACCVVTGANHPVIKTVWDRTVHRPTSRSALSDARPAWAYGSPHHTQRLCFPHCPLLTCPHHEHTATTSTRPMIFLWACSCASGAPTSHTAEIWVLFSSIVK